MPWMGFDLRELELRVIWVHALYFLSSRCTKDLHYSDLFLITNEKGKQTRNENWDLKKKLP
jgi:hypothetical protein